MRMRRKAKHAPARPVATWGTVTIAAEQTAPVIHALRASDAIARESQPAA
jgi:hypothetical protein